MATIAWSSITPMIACCLNNYELTRTYWLLLQYYDVMQKVSKEDAKRII
jgi:hypothetical protein